MDDTDLAGPLVFCLAFGGFLLLVSIWFGSRGFLLPQRDEREKSGKIGCRQCESLYHATIIDLVMYN